MKSLNIDNTKTEISINLKLKNRANRKLSRKNKQSNNSCNNKGFQLYSANIDIVPIMCLLINKHTTLKQDTPGTTKYEEYKTLVRGLT